VATVGALDFFVQWHLTERCNLRCSHCYQSGRRGPELDLEECRQVVAEVADTLEEWSTLYGLSFSPAFNVTGGEPLLREDLFPVLEEISRRGFAISLLSNGTLVDRATASRLGSLGVRGVQVSVEGSEEVHDRIRGRGSRAAALEGVNRLLEAGLTVTLNTTLSSLNADTLEALADEAGDLGVHRIGFSRLVPSGRGAALRELLLAPGEVRELYAALFARVGDRPEVVTGDPLASQLGAAAEADEGLAFPRGGCAAGFSGLTVLSDGTLTPCRRLPLPIGNIRQDSLREVWAESPLLARLRDRSAYQGRCGRCPRWASCRGCRAIAYACSLEHGPGDPLAEDPQCFVEAGGRSAPSPL
jgi:radical SAM protein with 4Fe4S-binding SPASM domain